MVRSGLATTAVVLAMSSCATSTPIMGPNGAQHFNVSCPRTIENCYEEAARVCPNGYQVVDKNDNSTLVPVNGSVVAARKFSMLIECRAAQAASPAALVAPPAPPVLFPVKTATEE